jgi:two-component system phosphate regulon sensor histidine kinase PhoR
MSTDKDVIKNLIEQNAELENYFRNTIIPQLFVDENFILRKFTPPAMKQFNLASTDIGKSLVQIQDNFRYPSMIENIQAVIDSNEILEKEIQTTDLRWYQMNILPYIQKENNKSNGVIITFVEITFRIKDLKEQEKLISDHETLLDTISHDIKNPLTNLVFAIDQFKSMDPEDQQGFAALLEIVERALTKMKNLINELSDSREQDHKYRSHVELLNFEHILEDVRLTLSDDIKASGAIIRSDVQVSEMTFSRRKLRSIIYNLLNNSIKYKSPLRRPEIFIKTIHDNDYTIISITDNGIGIDKNNHDAVFSKYYRLDNALEGSGIGLYLVKELVINAGGKILMESELDKGTQIKIFLKQV